MSQGAPRSHHYSRQCANFASPSQPIKIRRSHLLFSQPEMYLPRKPSQSLGVSQGELLYQISPYIRNPANTVTTHCGNTMFLPESVFRNSLSPFNRSCEPRLSGSKCTHTWTFLPKSLAFVSSLLMAACLSQA